MSTRIATVKGLLEVLKMHKLLTSRKGGFRLWLLLGLGIILVAPVLIGAFRRAPKEPNRPALSPVSAWHTKVAPHLDRLDQVSASIAEKHLARISAFFSDKKRGGRDFAAEAFSLTAKFYLVKGKLFADDGAGFRQWLQGTFEEKVFRAEDLQALIASVIGGYVAEMQGLENDALVQIRADIAEDDLFHGKMPELQTDQAFQDEYRRLAEEVLPKVVDDLNVGAAGFLTNLALTEVATTTLGPGLVGRLGISGSGLWSGLARSGTFIGVGMVAWWALDKLIDWLLDLFGYGPAAELAGRVEQALGRLESNLIDGEQMQEVQLQFQADAEPTRQGGMMGLRSEFQKLQVLQSKVRREALLKLVTQGGQ